MSREAYELREAYEPREAITSVVFTTMKRGDGWRGARMCEGCRDVVTNTSAVWTWT